MARIDVLAVVTAWQRRPPCRALARWPGRGLLFWLPCLLLACLLLGGRPAAAEATPPAEPDQVLDQARQQVDAVQKAELEGLDDGQLQRLRKQVLDAQVHADELATRLAPQLSALQAQLAELGTLAEGATEAPDVAAQRKALVRSVGALDAQIKLARLLSVEAEQAAGMLWTQRRAQFQARLGERSHAVLTPPFWAELAEDFPRDVRQLQQLLSSTAQVVQQVRWGTWAVVALCVGAVLLLRHWASRRLLVLTTNRVPSGRLRRSLQALGVVLVGVVTPGLVALSLFTALTWGSAPPEPVLRLLGSASSAVWFGGFVAGLGTALLSVGKPSWRLPPLSDALAQRLRWLPLALALLVVLGWVSGRVAAIANVSLATTVALNALQSLSLGGLLAAALLCFEQVRRSSLQHSDEPVVARPLWLSLLFAAGWLVLVASLVAVAIGYVALGSFAINQMVWATVVLSAAYLAAVLLDDLFSTVLAVRPEGENSPPAGLPTNPQTRAQAAVLLSGLGQVVVGLLALLLLMAPYGEGPSELFRRSSQLQEGLRIGEVAIRPGALLQALLVLVVCLLAVRLVKGWLRGRYLPTTRLDSGMQLTAATLFGYAGVVAAVSLSMSAIGIGLERVAWVASALSVGIGFGLQAVVQNFVSGLILLTERPVKVGDWVSLGGVEGDIRRINVRATEIQLGDRSTVIMPNSEFITKTVRNVTHANPLGLVQIKLPMPLGTDAQQVRALMLAALQDHEKVLETPAPNVQLDGIDSSNLVFNATGFVDSPRSAYGVRSELLFEVLRRMEVAGLEMARQPTLLLTPGPGPASAALPPLQAVAPPPA